MSKIQVINKIENILEYLLARAGNSSTITLNSDKNTSLETISDIYYSLNSYYGNYIFFNKKCAVQSIVTELTFSKSTVKSRLSELKVVLEDRKRQRLMILIVAPLMLFSLLTLFIGIGIGFSIDKNSNNIKSLNELGDSFVEVCHTMEKWNDGLYDRLLLIEKKINIMADSNSMRGGNTSDN